MQNQQSCSKFNVIIPCAGEATRMRPITSNISKAMVRVNGKPCIDFILEKVIADGAESIIIVDGAYSDIRKYVSKKYKGYNIKFTSACKKDGPGNSIWSGLNYSNFIYPFNKELSLVVWLGDTILLDSNIPYGSNFLITKEVEYHSDWCLYDGKQYYNKPSKNIPNAKALVGVYGFDKTPEPWENIYPEIYQILEHHSDSYKMIDSKEWYDIGNIPNYYQTCAELLKLKSRNFNVLNYDRELGIVEKSVVSDAYHDVIVPEKMWYENLTEEQSLFTPRFIHSDDKNTIRLSYESGILLSDLLLYEEVSDITWEYILEKVVKIMDKYFHTNKRNIKTLYDSLDCYYSADYKMWYDKTRIRLGNTDFEKHEKKKLLLLAEEVSKFHEYADCIHGDLHLGNIIYNPYSDKIILIDPRGEYKITQNGGNPLYDWCKLSHDIVLGYSSIVNNCEQNINLVEIYKKLCSNYDIDYELTVKGAVVLLASCIPLHSDDSERQARMMERVREYL
jgi:hypothetical protein